MNISANQIAHHIEEKLVNLRKAIAEENESIVKECATAIEAYCQLLKGVPNPMLKENKDIQETTAVVLSSPPLEKSGESLGNLLDF